MKKLFLLPFLLLFGSPLIAEVESDPRILCIRNQVKFDIANKAFIDMNRYMFQVWGSAYKKEKKKYEARGETLNDSSILEEPYKSISKEFDRLSRDWNRKKSAEEFELFYILKISGYSRPLDYFMIRTMSVDELREKYGIFNVFNIPDYKIAEDYYGAGGSGRKTREKLCKLYGIEFDPKTKEFNEATKTKKES
ncbi:hypothetical protein OA105_01985 [Prochlorococcus sp. AH-736-B08]|nr:hypothetical protein [Prochlorococcus sp. AH-736-B08]